MKGQRTSWKKMRQTVFTDTQLSIFIATSENKRYNNKMGDDFMHAS